MTKSLNEQYLILGGIKTVDLQTTRNAQFDAGFTVIQQIYVGDDFWELMMVKNQPLGLDAT